MSVEIVSYNLEATDTLVSLRQRLAGLRGRRVLLIWPEAAANLRSKLDLVLIQREADRRAVQLAIVTTDEMQRFYAAELNISCFDSLEASQSSRWKRGRKKLFLPRYHKPSPDLRAEDLALIAGRLSRRNQRSRWRTLIERLAVLALLTGVVGAALYAVVPGAEVVVSLQKETITVVVDVVADRKADALRANSAIIPAQVLRETVETSATVPATGTVWLDSVSAAAIVTFANLGADQVDIPRGTILATSAGEPILFETAAQVVVPAGVGQRVDATVEAMTSHRGSVGNVGPGMINTVLGELSDRVSAINLAPAAGGSNQSVKTVAAGDKRQLLESARIQLQSLAYEQMRAGLSESQVIIIESLRIEQERKEWTRFSADVGAMTSELSLTMRAVVSALVVDDRYGRQLAAARLRDKIPANFELVADSLTYARGPFKIGRADGQINFTATASAAVIATFEGEQLRERLAGISLAEARDLLAMQPELSSKRPPRISLYPPSLQRMPIMAVRIRVRESERQ